MTSFLNIWADKKMIFRRIVFLYAIIISSCTGRTTSETGIAIQRSSASVSIADRFRIERYGGMTKVTIINPWQGADNVNLVYHLVRRGSDLPPGVDSSSVIFVPVKKIICMSTTHLAMISALGEESSVSGVSGTNFIFAESLLEKVKMGLIEDVGYESNLNKELILKISPDLIMMYGIGSESAAYLGKIEELGVKVLFNADYLETDPLAKVEWIKLFGALYGKEDLADSIYNSEVKYYNQIKLYVENNISARPKVLLGLPFKDTWYISPGNSFISKLITDAGGDYLWQNTISSVSMPYGIENVYLQALVADFWLNTGSIKTKDEILLIDQRLKDLRCFRQGNIFNNNNRVTINGGNDFWESGSISPHIILKDIAAILHPGLFKDYDLYFYKKIY